MVSKPIQEHHGEPRLDRWRALVSLLADDSPTVRDSVTRALVEAGKRAVPALRWAEARSDARLRVRARRLRAILERTRVYRRLLAFATQDGLDLERGLFLLGRLDLPDLDRRPYTRALDAMGTEVLRRVTAEEDDFAGPMALASYLGNELGFAGDGSDLHHPDNVHLHRAIERKRGLPLTLVAIYLLVARRAGLRAAPVALPGRVFLRLYLKGRSLLLDPFEGGRARTKSDCIRYLAQHNLVPRPEWFRDASDAVLFQRQLLNLMHSSQLRGLQSDARTLHLIALAMNRAHAPSPRAQESADTSDEGARR